MGKEGILGEAEYHIRRPMPSITAGASPTPRHGGWWRQQATSHMPAALGRRGLTAPERHTSHRAKSCANSMLLGAQSRDLLSCRGQAPGGGWGVAEIMTSVDIIV